LTEQLLEQFGAPAASGAVRLYAVYSRSQNAAIRVHASAVGPRPGSARQLRDQSHRELMYRPL